MDAKIFLKRQDMSMVEKEIGVGEANEMIEGIGERFDINIMGLIKDIANHKADGFSLSKNNPYTHLYIGIGSEDVTIKLMTLEKEMKIKIPKSFFLGNY